MYSQSVGFTRLGTVGVNPLITLGPIGMYMT